MGRSTLGGVLGVFLGGLLLAVLLPARHGGWLLGGLILLPLLALRSPRGLPGWFALGVLLALVWQAWLLDLRPAFEPAQPVTVIGQIVDLPETTADGQRFLLAVERMDGLPRPWPRRLRVSLHDDGPRVKAGERWRMQIRLRRPRGYMNPVRFDYEQWLAAARIDARGYRAEPQTAVRLAPPSGLPAWRAELSARIAAAAGPGQGAALLQGLVVGDRRAFTDGTWGILRATGTSHLMAISGLHIGLVGGLGLLAGRGLWTVARVPGPRHAWALMFAGAAATGYAALAGFALPTRRALIMFAVFAMAGLLDRRLLAGRALLLAATVILVSDPAAALSAGFWLSFSAVGLILAVTRGRSPSGFRTLLRVQVMLTVGLAPVSALFFGAWSPLGLIANLLMIPLFSLVIVPATLGATALGLIGVAPGDWLLAALAQALEGLLVAGRWLEADGPGLQPLHLTGLSGLLCASAACGLMLLPRGIRLRGLALPLVMPLVLAEPARPAHGEAWIDWLEVGQGNAAVIRTRDTVTVVDTGPAGFSGGNAAVFTLKPFLEERGVKRVDRLMITHADRDHRGGVETLADAFTLDTVLVGEPVEGLPGATRCVAGQRWIENDVRFEVLAPEPDSQATGNAASCVLQVETAGGRVLFTGDIEGRAEQALARRLQRPVDIMEAPHHGSRRNTSAELLEAARPQGVVIPAGYRNPYRLPHPAVIERLRCRGIRVHDIGLTGALQVRLGQREVATGSGHRVRVGRWLNEPRRIGRFRGGEEIHYHSRLTNASGTETGQPLCGN